MLIMIGKRYVNIYSIAYIEERHIQGRYNDMEAVYDLHMNNGEIIEVDDRTCSFIVQTMHIR